MRISCAYPRCMLNRRVHRVRRPGSQSRPVPQRALEDLRFIRETMERSSTFTATPGWGQVGMGLIAIAAAFIAARQPSVGAWLATWLLAALVAVTIAVAAMQIKAHRAGLP